MAEQFENLAKTSLDGAIISSDTAIDVIDGSVFPTTGNFRITIDPAGSAPEIAICTSRSGNTLTVTRGEEGTVADSFGDGTVVIHAITKASLHNLIDERLISEQPYVIVRRNANQSLTNNTETALAFDTEDADSYGFHAASSTDVVIPAGGDGLYAIDAGISYAANATGVRWTQIKKNGTGVASTIGNNVGGSSNYVDTLSTFISLAAGDVITLVGYQNSGGALDSTGRLSLTKMGLGNIASGSGVPAASVYRTANQAHAGGSDVAVEFTAENFDTSNFHDNSTNNTRVTAPSSGFYMIGYSLGRTASGEMAAFLRVNGDTNKRHAIAYGSTSVINLTGSAAVYLNAGDYIELMVFATSAFTIDGTSANTVRMWIAKIPSSDAHSDNEVAYAENSSSVTINSATEAGANTLVTAPAFTADGVSSYLIEFHCEGITMASGGQAIVVDLFEDGSPIGFIAFHDDAAAAGLIRPTYAARRLTPTAGSHTYSIRAHTSSGGSGTANAGAGGSGANTPMHIRITKVKSTRDSGTVGTGGAKVSSTISGLGAPRSGDIGSLRVGSSPYEFKTFIYDSTYGKWVSEPIPLIMHGNTFNDTGTSYTSQITQDSLMIGNILGYRVLYDAGARLQFRLKGLLSNSGANLTYAQLQGAEFSDTDTAATAIFTVCEISNSGATAVFKISAWTEPTAWTPADSHMRVVVQTKVSSGTGSYFQLHAEYRWVANPA